MAYRYGTIGGENIGYAGTIEVNPIGNTSHKRAWNAPKRKRRA
jgi:hypothetical protein